MKKIAFLFVILIVASLNGRAQLKQEQDAIKKLCGCYEIEFMYTETFAPDPANLTSKPYTAHGMEWVVAEETSDKKIVIQHLLQLSDSMIIKHWREDWEYEKAGLLKYNHDNSWVYAENKNPKGQWVQTVWEVDDAPRYQGSSRWISNNGKYYWENTADAPLPRREYSVRSDYNVLERTNKVIVTDTGWVHEQDNRKIKRTDDGADKLLAEEKGFNIYAKVDDSKCAAAAAWWNQHKNFWNTVRASWEEVLKGKSSVKLATKVTELGLSGQLEKLEKENLNNAQLKERAVAILQQFTGTNTTTAGN